MYKIIFAIGILVIGIYIVLGIREDRKTPVEVRTLITSEHYACADSKTIDATYYKGATSTVVAQPNMPPIPTGSVDLTLSDGHTMTLKQTLSADGARYSNEDITKNIPETFVFWSKGNGAMVLQNGTQKDFIGCVVTAPLTDALQNVYHDTQNNFTILYPTHWTVNDAYRYNLRGPDMTIPQGVKFVIPNTMATGTNLSSRDTGVSIETASTSINTDCNATLFTNYPVAATTTAINGVTYSMATTSDAGAGNFYEEQVYAIPYSRPCTAIRYFIHSTNIGNYTPGTIVGFDYTALIAQFDAIRDSLVRAQ